MKIILLSNHCIGEHIVMCTYLKTHLLSYLIVLRIRILRCFNQRASKSLKTNHIYGANNHCVTICTHYIIAVVSQDNSAGNKHLLSWY